MHRSIGWTLMPVESVVVCYVKLLMNCGDSDLEKSTLAGLGKSSSGNFALL